MAQDEQYEPEPLSFLDALYCEEERWEEEEEEEEEEESERDSQESDYRNKNGENPSLLPLLLLEQDLFWEDEELLSLFSKEQQISLNNFEMNTYLAEARQEAVQWMLRVNTHYAFSALTAVFAINYLDRFLPSFEFQRDKPWMIQLAAVACLSLAAKVEETQVPLLLDLQLQETKYVFEAKTIQKMELLVLSTLHWKMNPVTPFSFLDHIIRRLGLKNHLHWEFFRRCELLLLSVIADSRLASNRPSVLATAIMLHVINQIEPFNPIDYQNQLLGVLKMSKEKVDDCYQLILDLTESSHGHKRKYECILGSPKGVIDASFSCDCSNDSWAVADSEHVFKKNRAQEQDKPIRLFPFNRVAVEVLGSPR